VIVTIPELGYELRPYAKGTCWQLFEYVTDRANRDGDPLPDTWVACECYPGTLEHGLSVIAEKALRSSPVAGDLRAARTEVRRVSEAISSACAQLGEHA
jgi:hypothetical protein